MSDLIPPKERPEWAEMAQGQHKTDKFVLQLQIDRVGKKMDAGEMTLYEAIDELYSYFQKYPKGFQSDLRQIFQIW